MQEQGALMGIKNQLFEVVKVPLYTPPLGVFQETLGTPDAAALGSPNQFGIYKTTGGSCLGVSGDIFQPVQPKDLLAAFTSCLASVQDYGGEAVDLSKLTYVPRKGGARVEFSIPVPGINFVNKAGLRDIVNMFLTVSTGFDGTATRFRLDVDRLICENGWTQIKTEFQASIRSTKNAAERIAFSCDEIAHTIAAGTKAEELILALNSADLSGRQTQEFVNRVFGFDIAEREEAHWKTQARMDSIMESMELEMSRTGATLWGALNGITHYTNHVSETKWDRGDYILLGTGAKVNKQAQLVAMDMLI
jgi:hypothetical protein